MISQHFQTSCDPLVRECFNLVSQIPPSKSLVTLANKFASDLNFNSVKKISTGQLNKVGCSAQWQQLKKRLCKKPLHGKFFSLMKSDSIKTSRSFQWLKHLLHSESESSIFAIQDQVICTRVYQAKIIRSVVPSLLCKLCSEHEETV